MKPRPRDKLARTEERIELALADGTVHSGVLSVPARAKKKLPVIIVLGGFETGEKALGFLRENLDVIYATTDYPYRAPNQRSFARSLNELSEIRSAVRRTDLAVDALVERLRRDPRVDPEKLTFAGASFGAPFAITGAVRNPEIDGVILIHAFGRVDLAITRQLANDWGAWSYPFAWLFGRIAWEQLGYPTPEAEVRKLHPHQHVFYVHSDADEQLPCESIESLFEALGRSPAQVTTAKSQGGHLAPGKTKMIDELMDVSVEWMRDRGLL